MREFFPPRHTQVRSRICTWRKNGPWSKKGHSRSKRMVIYIKDTYKRQQRGEIGRYNLFVRQIIADRAPSLAKEQWPQLYKFPSALAVPLTKEYTPLSFSVIIKLTAKMLRKTRLRRFESSYYSCSSRRRFIT